MPAGENIILRSMLEIDCIALYVVNVAKKQREVWASKTGREDREDRADWEGGQQDPKEPEANLLLIKSLCNNPFLRPWIGIRIETYPILFEKEKD